MGLRQNLAETANDLELTYYWYQPYHKIGCIFMLVWDFFSCAFWSPVLVPLFRGEVAFPKNIFALCTFFMLIPAPTYWMLLHVINKTRVHLSRSEVVVRNGPLPWLRRNQTLPLQHIKCISIEELEQNSLADEIWQVQEDKLCHVKAIMKNGESRYIFQNVQNFAEARLVRSRMSLWLLETSRAESK